MLHAITLQKETIKAKSTAILTAIVFAVALPQLFHVLGAVSGMGTSLGQAFLPMHLPILLVGLLAGPVVGTVAGALSPLLSFALSGMPGAAMVPFMMIELAGYGLAAGFLGKTKMPVIVKLLLAQVAGRIIRAAAGCAAVYGMGSEAVTVSSIWMSIATGLPGLALQWCLIPLAVFWLENREKSHA